MGGLPSLTEKQHQRERVVLQMHQNHSLRPSLSEGVFSGSCHLAEEASEKIGGLNHNILSGVSPAAICRLLGGSCPPDFPVSRAGLRLRHSLGFGGRELAILPSHK